MIEPFGFLSSTSLPFVSTNSASTEKRPLLSVHLRADVDEAVMSIKQMVIIDVVCTYIAFPFRKKLNVYRSPAPHRRVRLGRRESSNIMLLC